MKIHCTLNVCIMFVFHMQTVLYTNNTVCRVTMYSAIEHLQYIIQAHTRTYCIYSIMLRTCLLRLLNCCFPLHLNNAC